MPENPTAPTSSPAASTPPSSPATDSIGSGPNQVVFEAPPTPPVETPVAAPVPTAEPFQIAQLENGQKEVRLSTGSVFRGTDAELINELSKSVYNGSVKIAELNQRGPFAPPAETYTPPSTAPGQMDPTAIALADLVAQGLGMKDRNDLLEQVAMLPQLQQNFEQQQLNAVAGQFLAKNQDFPMSDRNVELLDAAVTNMGVPLTPQNIEVVHHYLKSTGQYEKVMTPASPQSSNPMPSAPNGQGHPNGAIAEQDLWAMPMNELERYMRKQ